MLPVPNGLAPEVAALTEPMAVAWHAVRRGEVGKKQVAIVIGCGPVGLGVILMLKAKGVRTVVASDFSPGRRALATACGADVVVDPADDVAVHRRRRSGPPHRPPGRARARRRHAARSSAACPSAGGTCGALAEKLGAAPEAPGDLRVRRRARA